MLILSLATAAFARTGDADEAYHFHDVAPVGDEVRLGVVDAWARPHEAKAKIIVRNDTPDFLVVRTGGMLFSAHGQAWAEDDVQIIPPRDTDTKVLEFTGQDLKANGGWLVPGGMYRVPTDADPVLAPDFELPVQARSFDAGPFHCTVAGKITQETDETAVKFRCTFEGEGLGMVDTSAITVVAEGQTFPNRRGDGRLRPVLPGQSFSLRTSFEVPPRVVDMQFAELTIQFNDAFRDGVPQVLPQWDPIALEVDWKKTH